VVEHHISAGTIWACAKGVEVTGYVMHVPRNTVHGNGSIPASFGGGDADVSLGETSVWLKF